MANKIEINSRAPLNLNDPTLAARRANASGIRWGAIFAGIAVGTAVQLLLTLLGFAAGLTSMDIAQGETVNPIAPLLWGGASMLIAGFAGAYVAARMSGLKRRMDGLFQGVVTWGVTTLMIAFFATTLSGTLLSGMFSALAPAVASKAEATSSADSPAKPSASSGNPLADFARSQLGNVDAQSVQKFQQAISAGNREQAIQLLTSSASMEPARAGAVVDQALIISGSPSQASPQSRATADKAVKTAGSAMWGAFIAVALSLLVGIAGGMLGAAGSRRLPWVGTQSAA
ncbi:hypothetical protein BH11PSE11_BH11PSE11_04780 [soil metagenome]